jgi:CubicO group peptidase (beta-lactamase class C family)
VSDRPRPFRLAGSPALARAIAAAVAGCLLANPTGAIAQAPPTFDAAWRGVADRFHRTLEAEGVVGGALWFVRGEETLAREFHGFADLGSGRRVDENTIFHWASITKTLTGVAIMQLRDRGLLSLDDPVVRYLPELRLVHDPFGPVDAITIRHLMTHSAGFRAGTWPWGGDDPWHPFEPTEWAQIVAMLPYTEVRFEPGSRYSYSNPGILFLGEVIERLSGEPYETYVDKNILRPLRMRRSYFDRTPPYLLPDRSNSYAVRVGEPVANGLDFDTGITVSNSGLNAPIPDMARYLAFVAGDATERPAHDLVLARSSLEEMWRARLEVPPAADGAGGAPESGTREAIGLAFFVLERGPVRLVGHTGDQRSFRSFFYLDPSTGAAAIAVLNTDRGTDLDRPEAGAILEGLRDDLIERVFPLFR